MEHFPLIKNYIMKTNRILQIVVTMILLVTFDMVNAQENIDENILKIYTDWQTSNCDLPENGRLIDLLQQNAQAIQPLLLRGFNEGPPKEYLNETMGNEMRRIDQNLKTIATDSVVTGLTKDDLAFIKGFDKEKLKKQTERNIINGWRTRALSGLSNLKETLPKDFFEKIASDEENEFSQLAKHYLKQQ